MPTKSTRARRFFLLLALSLPTALLACSVIVSTNSAQCGVDADCTSFAAGATCDQTSHICVPPGSSSSGTSTSGTTSSTGSGSTTSSSGTSCNVDGGSDGGGCYACAATNNSTLLNACTTGCISFDDSRVKGALLDGGGLPPFPNPGPDGGM